MRNYTPKNKSKDYKSFILQPPLKFNTLKSRRSALMAFSEGVSSGSRSGFSELPGAPLLGNREVRRQIEKTPQKYAKLFEKYKRKSVAEYALTVGNQSGQDYNKALHTTNKSLCSCGRDAHFQNQAGNVEIKQTKSSRHLRGVKSCGSVSACPVCASKLSFVRGNQLSLMLLTAREHQRGIMMSVVTIPHQPGESLEITLNQVIDMSTYIFRQSEWKQFKKLSQHRFSHFGLENMASVKNGRIDWHPHKNYLFDFDISLQEITNNLGLDNTIEMLLHVSKLLTRLGQKYLDEQGINKTLLTPYLQKVNNRIVVKGGISCTADFDDTYVTKWGLDAEMTAGIYKDGRFGDSFHPFVLLDFIHHSNKDFTAKQKFQFVKAFQEFVIASKGKNWFKFASGSAKYYHDNYGVEIKAKSDEEELLSFQDSGDDLLNLEAYEWRLFRPKSMKIGKALSMPTTKELIEFIYDEIERNRIIEYEKSEAIINEIDRNFYKGKI